jgi:hypothetical protein
VLLLLLGSVANVAVFTYIVVVFVKAAIDSIAVIEN